MVDTETNDIKMTRVEITQHGRHSTSVTDVIGKKLMKRYQDGTVLVVLVVPHSHQQFPPLIDCHCTYNGEVA